MISSAEIDPTEIALAVIGVRPIVSKEVERILMSQVHEMENFPKRIVQEAKLVMREDQSDIPLGSVNYKQILKLLTEEYSEDQLTAMASKFPTALAEQVTGHFLIKAKQLISYLKQLLPVMTRNTLLGPENILPSQLAVRRFATTLDVLDNPLRVFPHIAHGSLLKSQAQAVKQIYPTSAQAIDQELGNAAEAEKANRKSFKLPPKVEIGWCAWKGQPRFPPKLMQALQANFAKAKAEQPKPQTQSGGAQSVVAKEAMTNIQRSLYPTQTSTKG
jgi:hypothetical protein